ncbi:MAG: FMN-binding protein [Candidatus Cloacimonadota bacterium]|nr:FMN-binding protein [Candidatus Cloacimonadota bacterium]
MAEVKKTFSDSKIYPIFFMILITVIFIGFLATFYEITASKVKAYETENNQRIILQLFELPTDNLQKNYNDFIEVKKHGPREYFLAAKDGKILGYAFPIKGSGLWGTIEAVVAVTPDFDRIIAFDITKQNETPGLGGRITEPEFKEQFGNKKLLQNDKVIKYNLVAEDDKAGEFKISQITGATQSSKAVVQMLYKELKLIREEIGVSYE